MTAVNPAAILDVQPWNEVRLAKRAKELPTGESTVAQGPAGVEHKFVACAQPCATLGEC